MRSNKFLKIADRIVKQDKELFETLMDFEKTKKVKTKTRLNFTIDRSLASKFKKFCRDKGYNMSAKVEHALREMLKKAG